MLDEVSITGHSIRYAPRAGVPPTAPKSRKRTFERASEDFTDDVAEMEAAARHGRDDGEAA